MNNEKWFSNQGSEQPMLRRLMTGVEAIRIKADPERDEAMKRARRKSTDAWDSSFAFGERKRKRRRERRSRFLSIDYGSLGAVMLIGALLCKGGLAYQPQQEQQQLRQQKGEAISAQQHWFLRRKFDGLKQIPLRRRTFQESPQPPPLNHPEEPHYAPTLKVNEKQSTTKSSSAPLRLRVAQEARNHALKAAEATSRATPLQSYLSSRTARRRRLPGSGGITNPELEPEQRPLDALDVPQGQLGPETESPLLLVANIFEAPTPSPTGGATTKQQAVTSTEPDPTGASTEFSADAPPEDEDPTSPATTPAYQFEKAVFTVKGVRVNAYLGSGRAQGRVGDGGDKNASCTQDWQRYLEDRIEGEVMEAIPPSRVETLVVELRHASQSINREQAMLVFTFDVTIEIRSPLVQYDIKRFVEGPFHPRANNKAGFVDFLRKSVGCPKFASVTAVTVKVPEERLPPPPPRQQEARPLPVAPIAGLAAALLTVTLLYMICMRSPLRNSHNVTQSMTSKDETEEDDDDDSFASSKVVRRYANHDPFLAARGARDLASCAVSSMGDPNPFDAGVLLPATDLSTQGSVSIGYDYLKAYAAGLSAQSGSAADSSAPRSMARTTSSSSGFSDGDSTLACDDATLDAQYVSAEQIEVEVGPGLLGLILNSGPDGLPFVSHIKPSSILADEVRVGDLIISVDDVDVTVMSAPDVSKLISSKNRKEMRRFVFIRTIRPDV